MSENKIKNGGPAFPSLKYQVVEAGEEIGEYASYEGMTLRDWFAGQAMRSFADTGWNNRDIATRCYELADAMLKERES